MILLGVAVGTPIVARADDAANSPSPPALIEQLDAIHKQAREARAKKDYGEVERLRLERRRLIAESSEGTRWNQGLVAIEKATEAVARMQYKQACKLLRAAWEPFASMPSRQAVFGDVAMELFLANEAARMVDPNEVPVEPEKLRECLTRAAADDPCQVEVSAALAFLTPPNADEAMRRLDDRRFVRDRNERLLAIQRAATGGSGVLPWHAPVEYLLAKSSSFVLGDLDYLRGFLRPDKRLGGSNRHGESWSLALGGGILVATTERRSDGVRSVFKLDAYDTKGRSWRQFAPHVIVVSSAASESAAGAWQLGVDDVQKRLVELSAGLEGEWRRRADERLMAIADAVGRPDVKVGVQKIRDGTWPGGPPPGSSIDAVLERAALEFGNLAKTASQRSDIEAATTAQGEVAAAREEYLRAKASKERAQDFFGKMSADDLAALRGLVEETEFAESAPAEPPAGKDSAKGGGFGAAPEPVVSRLQGFQLKAQLLDALSQAELLAACRAFQEDDAALKYLTGLNVDVFITGDQAMPGPQRTAALRFKEASRQLGELFGAISGAGGGIKRRPLKLDDFRSMRRQLEVAIEACCQLEVDESKTQALVGRALRLLGPYGAVVTPIDDREKLQRNVSKARPVRTWQIGTVDWKFYDLAGLSASDAAALIDGFRPLIVAEADLEAVSGHLSGGGVDPPAPSLRPGSWPARRPFVAANGTLNLRMQSPDRPAVVVALVERAGAVNADRGPHAFPDDKGRPALRVKDGGTSLWMRLDLDAGELVVDYPGLEGHIPIGIAAEPEKASRFIKDRRGYRVTAAPEDGPLLFELVAANGEKISGGYHSIADLVGIDRNIVNSFLPATLLYGPSLPAWQAYREQLLRWSPDPRRVRWAVPRPAYRVNE